MTVLARPDLVDGLRNRRQLVARGLAPIVLLVALTALVGLGGSQSGPEARSSYRLAVAGDVAGAAAIIDALEDARMRVETTDDVALAIAEGAQAGLVLPADADATLAAGQPLTATLVTDATVQASRSAGAQVRAVLTGLAVRVEPSRLETRTSERPPDRADRSSVEVLAQGAAALVLVQGGVLVGTAAARVAGRRATGVLVPLLVLAVPRGRLVAGRATSEALLGAIAGSPLLALAVLAAAVAGGAEAGAVRALTSAVVVVVAAVAVIVPLVTVGLAVGARARSPQQMSALASLGLIVVALSARWVALTADAPPAWMASVPVVGPAALVRQVIASGLDPLALVLMLLGTSVATAIAGLAATAAFGREQLALKSA